ncbi:MAG: class I SAM-dependent methyltransferase [Acidimicrobiia bacterium]
MSQSPNDAHARLWREETGSYWVQQQDVFDVMLAPFQERLLAILRPMPGERMLDIGCGCGTTTLAVAAAVGADDALGTVHGVDISAPMIERARERAEAAGVDDVTFELADAQVTDLGGPYDAVFSRFGVMFFADPVAAFANIGRSVRRGGRLAFVCWQDPARNPGISASTSVLLPFVTDPPPFPPPHAPGPFAFADDAHVHGVLVGSGWRNIEITEFESSVTLGGQHGGVDGAIDQMLANELGRLLVARADEVVLQQARAALADLCRDHLEGDEVVFPAAAWIVTATRP